MNLENMMLSEISQTQKDKYCMVIMRYLEYAENLKHTVCTGPRLLLY